MLSRQGGEQLLGIGLGSHAGRVLCSVPEGLDHGQGHLGARVLLLAGDQLLVSNGEGFE